jgi:hypothetical protein
MRLRVLALILIPITLAACDSSDGDSSIGGSYVGTLSSGGSTISYDFDIEETSGGSFEWTGEVTRNGDTQTASGTGTYDHPDISFTEQGDTVTGTVSDSRETITLQLPASSADLVLRRQD